MNHKTTSSNYCILLAVLIGLSLAQIGCAPTLVGQNAAVYSMGQLHARVEHNINPVYDAAVTALEELDISLVQKDKNAFNARVYGEASDGQNIGIKIDPETKDSTILVIYTGVAGNELRARAIFSKINDILNPVVADQVVVGDVVVTR